MPSSGLVSILHGDGQKEVERGGLAFLLGVHLYVIFHADSISCGK